MLKHVVVKMSLVEPSAKRFCSVAASQVAAGSCRAKKIAVEGNIATGKSTFLKLVSDSCSNYRVVGEPLTKWTNLPTGDEEVSLSQKCGGNLLGLFYNDPKRWAYTFQTFALFSRLMFSTNNIQFPLSPLSPIQAFACLSRLKAQLKSPPDDFPQDTTNPVIFYERSVYSDKFCFAQNCHESGLINDTEWSVYCDWYSFMLEFLPLQFDGFIYLKSSPEVSLERLRHRSRSEEKGVDLDYLTCLHSKHESWLVDQKVKPPLEWQREVPILILDCEKDFENDVERQQSLLKEVQQYINRLDDINNNNST